MAVYTVLSEEEIRHFLEAYALSPLQSFQGINAGVENTNYRITTQDGRQWILTLFEKRVAHDDVPFFTHLMELLASHHVPCPAPVQARDGKTIHWLKNKPAILVTFLHGKSVSVIQNAHVSALGTHMAHMHKAALHYENARANNLSLKGWKHIVEKITPLCDTITQGLADELHAEVNMLETLWPQDLPRGVIHGDLFPDNVFYDDKATLTGIIDFYFACNDFLAYDLAICLNAWCFEKTLEFNITRAKHFLRAYHTVRPLAEEELEALPILARGAALRFLLTRAYDWLFPVKGALVTPKDPVEYLKKLRFHRSVKHHRHYGL